MANPGGKGGFAKGQSGNPAGRSRRHIGDLSREARRYAQLALGTLVKICRTGMERNKLVAARELLDRGYGKPLQMLDMMMVGKKLSEMTPAELENFEARLMTAATGDGGPDDGGPSQGEFLLN
jgi:hypothetical protein